MYCIVERLENLARYKIPYIDVVVIIEPKVPAPVLLHLRKELGPYFVEDVPLILRCSSKSGFFARQPRIAFIVRPGQRRGLVHNPSRLCVTNEDCNFVRLHRNVLQKPPAYRIIASDVATHEIAIFNDGMSASVLSTRARLAAVRCIGCTLELEIWDETLQNVSERSIDSTICSPSVRVVVLGDLPSTRANLPWESTAMPQEY